MVNYGGGMRPSRIINGAAGFLAFSSISANFSAICLVSHHLTTVFFGEVVYNIRVRKHFVGDYLINTLKTVDVRSRADDGQCAVV